VGATLSCCGSLASYGGIFGLVIKRARLRLLIVTGRSRLIATMHRTTRNNFMTAYGWWLISRAWQKRCLLLTCRMFAWLAWLIISCEAKHVSKVFTKLTCSRETSLCHTSCLEIVLCVGSCIACIENIILAVVKTLGTILSKYGWMWCWGSRVHITIWNPCKMS